mmetsp:Transcript_46386/g.86201  ORF Transcript_46386/g.86201 Transcript_46386/m.86201 type:complete len:246 (+) Transcript_46386:281-1018(+)
MKCVTIALSAAAFLGADNAKGQQQAALPHRSSDGYDSNVNDGMWSRSRDKSTCTCTPRQFRTRSAPAEFPASCSITSMRCTAGKNWMRRGARPSQTRGTSWSAIASGYPAPTPSTSGATIVRRVRAARRASYKQSNTMFGTIHASAISQDRSSTSTPLLPKYSRTIPSFPSCWRATTAKGAVGKITIVRPTCSRTRRPRFTSGSRSQTVPRGGRQSRQRPRPHPGRRYRRLPRMLRQLLPRPLPR